MSQNPEVLFRQINALLALLTEGLEARPLSEQVEIGCVLDAVQGTAKKRLDEIRGRVRKEALTRLASQSGVERISGSRRGAATVTVQPPSLMLLEKDVSPVRRLLNEDQFHALFEGVGRVRFKVRPDARPEEIVQLEHRATIMRSLQQVEETPQVVFSKIK